jgi:hypothetical protein
MLPIGDPASLATGGGRVWSLSDEDRDPSTPPVLRERDAETAAVVGEPIVLPHPGHAHLAVGPDGYPWITFPDHGMLVSLRPTDAPAPSPS